MSKRIGTISFVAASKTYIQDTKFNDFKKIMSNIIECKSITFVHRFGIKTMYNDNDLVVDLG